MVNKEDKVLFRNTVGPVLPIQQGRMPPHANKPRPEPVQSKADERRALEQMAAGLIDPETLETGDELLYCRPGVQSRTLQKLRRGQFRIESELDLHGMITASAKKALSAFLANARLKNHRCIKVIHGKGLGSKDGKPVLKNRLNNWLQKQDEVLAFCSARPIDGGTGAVYILIQKSK